MKTVVIGVSINSSSSSKYVRALRNAFVLHGFRVILLTDGKRTHLVNKESNPIILTWPSRRPSRLKDSCFLVKLIFKYRPDIMIANFASVNLMMLVGFVMRVKTRLAWVRTLSTQLKPSRYLLWRKKMVYFCATRLIANSDSMKTDIMKVYGIRGRKIRVFPNAVEVVPGLVPAAKSDAIIYVGRLNDTKGVDVLIRGFSLLHREFPALRLQIIGDGEERDELESLCASLDMTSFITFKGMQSRDEVLRSFEKAKFAVVPSRHEAFGYVVIEAMSRKTVVIGSKVDGISEIIDDGINGLLFESENHEHLYSKMKYLVEHDDERRDLEQKAFEHIRTNYNVDQVAESFVSFVSS